jgi:hypothetical protein
MDSHFHGNDNMRGGKDILGNGNDRRRSENDPSKARVYGAGIKDTGMTYERVLVENGLILLP